MDNFCNVTSGSLVETPPCFDKDRGLITNSISYHFCLEDV